VSVDHLTTIRGAKDLLVQVLADGPEGSKDVLQEAKAAGISEKTLRPAKSQLKVKVRKTDFHGNWCWALPGTESAKVAKGHEDGQAGHRAGMAIFGNKAVKPG